MYVIGLAGGSGSGKTTFVNSLRAKYAGRKVTFISLDDYYLPRDQQEIDENGIHNFDLPSSIEVEALLQDLASLKQGQAVTRKEYTFNNSKAEATFKTFDPNPVIFIEGLFIYHYVALMAQINLKLFVDAPTDMKVIRRIRRDQIERNYPIDDVLYRYQNHVMPSYNQYILPYKDLCDIVVNNLGGMDGGLAVMSAYIDSKLAENSI